MNNFQLDTYSLLITALASSIILILAMLAFRASRNRFTPAMNVVIGNLGLALLSLHMLYIYFFSKSILFATLVPVVIMVYFTYRAIRGVYGGRMNQISDMIVLGATVFLNLIFTIMPRYSYRQIVYGVFVGYFFLKAFRMILRQTDSERTLGDIFVSVFLLSYAFMFAYRCIFFLFHYTEIFSFTSEASNPLFMLATIVLLLFGNAGFLIVATVKSDRERDRALQEALDQKVFAEHLVSIISHNLNSNMATINQAVDLMRKIEPENESVKELDIIERTIRQTGNVLTDLVYWGQSRSGTAPKSNSYVSVSALVWQVSEDLSQLILLKDIKLDFVEKKSNIHLLADSTAARVVLRNILSKILMFSPRSGLVTIEETPEDTSVEIAVRGSGRGMAEAVSKAFQPSENIDKETGTGLLIVSTICRSYGWPLTFQSDSSDTTGITVQFPRFISQ